MLALVPTEPVSAMMVLVETFGRAISTDLAHLAQLADFLTPELTPTLGVVDFPGVDLNHHLVIPR